MRAEELVRFAGGVCRRQPVKSEHDPAESQQQLSARRWESVVQNVEKGREVAAEGHAGGCLLQAARRLLCSDILVDIPMTKKKGGSGAGKHFLP